MLCLSARGHPESAGQGHRGPAAPSPLRTESGSRGHDGQTDLAPRWAAGGLLQARFRGHSGRRREPQLRGLRLMGSALPDRLGLKSGKQRAPHCTGQGLRSPARRHAARATASPHGPTWLPEQQWPMRPCGNPHPAKEIPGLISFRMDWLDLLAFQGTLKSLFQHHSSNEIGRAHV